MLWGPTIHKKDPYLSPAQSLAGSELEVFDPAFWSRLTPIDIIEPMCKQGIALNFMNTKLGFGLADSVATCSVARSFIFCTFNLLQTYVHQYSTTAKGRLVVVYNNVPTISAVETKLCTAIPGSRRDCPLFAPWTNSRYGAFSIFGLVVAGPKSKHHNLMRCCLETISLWSSSEFDIYNSAI